MSDNEQESNELDDKLDGLFGDEEETTNDVSEASVETTSEVQEEVVQEPQVNVEVTQAKKNGYLTEQEYEAKHGSLEGFKSPEQFNKYGQAWEEVSGVIKGMKKQLDERDKQIESLVKYNERVEERANNRARQELESQLSQARDIGDVRAVEELSKEKAKLEFHAVNQAIQNLELQRQDAERAFTDRNKHWFNVDPMMTNRAKQIAESLHNQALQSNTILSYDQVAKQIEAQLKYEYPDKMVGALSQPSYSAPVISATHSSTNKSVSSGQINYDKMFNSLNNDHRAIFNATNNMLKKSGKQVYSKKEFIDRLQKDGEI